MAVNRLHKHAIFIVSEAKLALYARQATDPKYAGMSVSPEYPMLTDESDFSFTQSHTHTITYEGNVYTTGPEKNVAIRFDGLRGSGNVPEHKHDLVLPWKTFTTEATVSTDVGADTDFITPGTIVDTPQKVPTINWILMLGSLAIFGAIFYWTVKK